MALPSVPIELMVSRARALAATPWPALLAATLKFKALAPLYLLASQANSCRPAAMLPSSRVSTNWPPAEKICTLTLSAALASSMPPLPWPWLISSRLPLVSTSWPIMVVL